MARILGLARSGFGKTASIGHVDEPDKGICIEGLDPKETYIISVTSKDLPFRGSRKMYPVTTPDRLQDGRRIITNKPAIVEKVLLDLYEAPPIKNVILDDANYLMQDYYMANALKSGWDAPKKIGYDMGRIFVAIEKYQYNKNLVVFAHGEDVTLPDGRIFTKMKTTGKMVDDYLTPEGKFDITLVGVSSYDNVAKKVNKRFITNEDEIYASPKSPIGMFELYVPNDLGYIIRQVNEFYDNE